MGYEAEKLREHADKSIEILRNNPFFPAPIDEGDNRDIDLSPSDYTDVGPNDRGSRSQHTPPAKLFVGAAAYTTSTTPELIVTNAVRDRRY